MSKRFQGGIIGVGFNPIEAPDAPNDVTAQGSGEQVNVSFSAPTDTGGSAIIGYTGRSSPDDISATGTISPLVFTGLTLNTSYTFQVWALNSYGPSTGRLSNSVTYVGVGARGLFGGGYTGVDSNAIDYVTITTTGNATDFGDLTIARYQNGAAASITRGLFAGGRDATAALNIVDYVTIGSSGNASDFGDLSQTRRGVSGLSSSTRGVFGGGYTTLIGAGGVYSNVIDYVTIASAGNAVDFGDLTQVTYAPGSASSSTRGLFAGGEPSALTNVISYITIASAGNATDFGDLTVARHFPAGCSSGTRAVFGGGGTFSVTNVIDYVTIATAGNATDFGDLTAARNTISGCASSARGLFGGGYTTTYVNVIDYVTIATTSNATDFGDLLVARESLAACSNAHGGLL